MASTIGVVHDYLRFEVRHSVTVETILVSVEVAFEEAVSVVVPVQVSSIHAFSRSGVVHFLCFLGFLFYGVDWQVIRVYVQIVFSYRVPVRSLCFVVQYI